MKMLGVEESTPEFRAGYKLHHGVLYKRSYTLAKKFLLVCSVDNQKGPDWWMSRHFPLWPSRHVDFGQTEDQVLLE